MIDLLQHDVTVPQALTPWAGLVLAGGQARRMGGVDKGLVLWHGRPLISYALASLRPVTERLYISANRHLETYRDFGHPVLTDAQAGYAAGTAGPLAGILAALQQVTQGGLLVVPCDVPGLKPQHLAALRTALSDSDAQCAVADDGKRLQPLVLALRAAAVRENLAAYLAAGQRKVEHWWRGLRWVKVDLPDAAPAFINLNTPEDLAAYEVPDGAPRRKTTRYDDAPGSQG